MSNPKIKGTFKVDDSKLPTFQGVTLSRYIALVGIQAEYAGVEGLEELGEYLSKLLKEKFEDGWVYFLNDGDQKPDSYKPIFTDADVIPRKTILLKEAKAVR